MARSPSTLLAPEFLERLNALRDVAFALRKKGEMRGLASGQMPEFDAHRKYEPGDEPRYIDWNVFARLEKLLLKMYVIEDETPINLLVDTSLSMREPSEGKLDMAARLAASFAYLALSSSRTVFLGAFSSCLEAVAGPLRSLNQFPACLQFLSSPPGGRGTDLGKSLGEFFTGRRGASLTLIFSDCLQEGDVVVELDRLRSRGSEPHLVQVLDHSDLKPDLRGECTVRDLEGEESLNLFVGHDLMSLMRRRLREYLQSLEEACRERSVSYLLATTSQDFEDLLLRHLRERAEGKTDRK